MNKKYDVVWSDIAENDLIDIVQFINNDSHSSALNLFRKFRNRAKSLYQSPHRGRIIPELRECGIVQYRELIISHWRLMYRIVNKQVYIIAVIDGRQNVEDVLLRRLIRRQ